MSTRKDLEGICEEAGLYFDTYAPGDGMRRYKFFREPGSGYFGPHSGFYTALGLREAIIFATGFALGRETGHIRDREDCFEDADPKVDR